ncbi:MAG: PHP domain-containing protein [Lentisphaeria bacterium]|nr:PHP domain-containing protein [Lentisphaeria bacterium]
MNNQEKEAEKYIIDLHTHSTFSDGSCTPTELVKLAAETPNLRALALTDHDSIEGLDEFFEAGKQYPQLELISGVEVSTLYGSKELHLVGLFIDYHNEELRNFLNMLKKERLDRNIVMAKRLFSLGYEIDYNELPYHRDDSLGRVHFAKYIMEKYDFPSIQAVFDQLLKQGKSAFVGRNLPLPSEAIKVIKNAGGIAIWAHPIFQERSHARSYARRIIRKLKPFGLDGIECHYSMFSPAQTAALTEIAESLEVLGSGGSDFHGSNRPSVQLGVGGGFMHIPYCVLTKMKESLIKS